MSNLLFVVCYLHLTMAKNLFPLDDLESTVPQPNRFGHKNPDDH